MTITEIIASTVAAFCGSEANPDALITIANRESRLTPTAVGDRERGAKAYEREHAELVAMGNPYANDPGRWAGSFGLYQLMPAYYARLWDPKADPGVLFDPRIATVVAGRLWNRAVAKGATNFVEVRLVWAGGSIFARPGDPEYDKRLDKWSVVDGEMNPSVRKFAYQGFGTKMQPDQWQRLGSHAVSGLTLFPLLMLGALGYWAYKKGVFDVA